MKDLRSQFKNRDCQKWIGLKQKDEKVYHANINQIKVVVTIIY